MTTNLKIRNARIKSTELGIDAHGIFTAYLDIEGDSYNRSFGGYAMDEYNKDTGERIGHPFGVDFIKGILETLGVSTWEELPGTFLRVKDNEWNKGIESIGHPIKELWFNPKEIENKTINQHVKTEDELKKIIVNLL